MLRNMRLSLERDIFSLFTNLATIAAPLAYTLAAGASPGEDR